MLKKTRKHQRKGAIVIFTALLLIPLLTFIALAVDLGIVAVHRTQSQNAADSAAMAGARKLNGNPTDSYHYSDAFIEGKNAAKDNTILGDAILDSYVTMQIGKYNYNTTTSKFEQDLAGVGAGTWTLAKATVTHQDDYFFAKVFGMDKYTVSTKAVAVHRPRDVVVVMDYSGSMRFDSLIGLPYTGTRTLGNNPESNYPVFGSYSATASAAMQNTATSSLVSGDVYGSANLTVATNSGDPIIDDFYSQNAFATPKVKAFTKQSAAYATTPLGDNYLKGNNNTNGTYAHTASEILDNSNTCISRRDAWETNGYNGISPPGAFNGYTIGPNYFGKTFFVWPPDPRPAKDWRQLYFYKRVGTNGTRTACDENQLLWDSSGTWRIPGTSVSINSTTYQYEINYNAILNWLKTVGTNPFPSQLRAGRIKYYDAIPSTLTTISTTSWPPTFPASPSTATERNERFWKDFIDFCLGVQQTSSGGSYTLRADKIGYGNMFSWSDSTYPVLISQKPVSPFQVDQAKIQSDNPSSTSYSSGTTVIRLKDSGGGSTLYDSNLPRVGQQVKFGTATTTYTISAVGNASGYKTMTISPSLSSTLTDGTQVKLYDVTTPSMDYRDNPKRPRMHFWFGPQNLLDFMGNYNISRFWWPGTCHEAPLWQCKLGIRAALLDMRNNHPNDYVSLIYFNHPQDSASDSDDTARFNRVRSPMGQNFTRMTDALFFPLYTIDNTGTEISPFQTTPADASIRETPNSKGGTCYPMALMLAYNQFSSASLLRNFATSNGLAGAPTGECGGLGRRGARKLLIFETDGQVNTNATANFVNGGVTASYYKVRVPTEFPTAVTSENSPYTNSTSNTYALCDQICALETATAPGHSTTRNPVVIHCIGFGYLFDPASSSDPDQARALTNLQEMQYRGNKANGEQTTNTTPLASYKRIYGSSATRIANLQTAFKKINDDGVAVSLIE